MIRLVVEMSESEAGVAAAGDSSFVRVKWQKMTYNDVQVVLQDTVATLKLLLEKVTGVPVASQKLTCCGKILKDNVSLYVV